MVDMSASSYNQQQCLSQRKSHSLVAYTKAHLSTSHIALLTSNKSNP